MLRIRFIRTGKKNRPNFRLVVTSQRTSAKTGKFLEMLGSYDPVKHQAAFKKDRIRHWLSLGASPSNSVLNMLISESIVEGKKVAVHSRPLPPAAEGEGGVPKKKDEEEKVQQVPTDESKADNVSSGEGAATGEEENKE